MYLPLSEIHTYIGDAGIDSSYMQGNATVYKPGIPTFFTNGWGPVGNFGAALTPLPDSSLLVYRAITFHPLGLVPGDVVLGYDRIPWKRLYKELLSAQLPLEWWYGPFGSTQRSLTHTLLNSAGNNWGLFDTVDVVKYTTGDTLHLATVPLSGLDWFSLFASEQVPVSGVTMPDYLNGGHVTWGVVQNTSIGYVYVYGWQSVDASVVAQALNDLIIVKKVTGLILDFRFNTGTYDVTIPSDAWYSYLFNQVPGTSLQWQDALRSDPSNHFSFAFSDPWPASFTPRTDSYDRPIAVLLGPAAFSNGDLHPFRMRFHPMARSFGLPTNGSFPAYGHVPYVSGAWGSWYYQHVNGQMRSSVNNEGFLMHKGFPVDEEVWLTRDGVAKGKDDVVERALAWITSLTYAHDVAFTRSYTGHHLDSVFVTARLTNPLTHSAALSAIVTDTGGVVRDSVLLYNDGMHHDGLAGDSLWECRIPLPSDEGIFKISVRTDDITQGSFRKLPNIGGFATAGPLTLDSVDVTPYRGSAYQVTPYVRNNGSSFTVRGASVTVRCDDPWVSSTTTAGVGLPDLPPGTTMGATSPVYVYLNSGANPTYFNLKAEISIGGVTYWTDSTKRILTGVEKQEALPARYALDQNYPNPFNPATTIRYSLPHKSQVLLAVYNTLGQHVVTLVHGQQEAGSYEVKFDGSNLASGVYFYRLQSGGFLEAKKLVIAK
jgi:hypothetical protein